MPSLLDKVKNKLGMNKSSSSSGNTLGGADYAGQQEQQQHDKEKQSKMIPSKFRKSREMTFEEKESRRDAMAAAAAGREKAWDNKLSKGAQARRQQDREQANVNTRAIAQAGLSSDRSDNLTLIEPNKDTVKSVEQAKRAEQQLAEVYVLAR